MRYKVNKLPKSLLEIDVFLDEKDLEGYYKEAEKAINNEKRFEGALKRESEVNEKPLDDRAIALSVSSSYLEIVPNLALELIGPPEVKVKKFVPKRGLEYSVKVAYIPEIELPDYLNIAKEVFSKKEEVKVDEKEVEMALDYLRKSRERIIEKNKPAEKGDFVEVEYSVFDENGKEVLSNKDLFELGQGKYLAGFEEQIIGLDKGGRKEFELEIPSDFKEKDWRGRKMKFFVKLNLVGQKEEIELNDEFAQSLGNFPNLEILKKNIEEGLRQEKELALKERKRFSFLEKVSSKLKEMEIPEILINSRLEESIGQLKEMAKSSNLPFDKYLELIKKDENKLREEMRESIEKSILNFLIIRKIYQDNKIEVGEEEVKEYAQKLASQYPQELLEKEGLVDQLYELSKERLIFDKSFEFLERAAQETG